MKISIFHTYLWVWGLSVRLIMTCMCACATVWPSFLPAATRSHQDTAPHTVVREQVFALSGPTRLLLTLKTLLINTQRDGANTFKPGQVDGWTETPTHSLPTAGRNAFKLTATISPPFEMSAKPKVWIRSCSFIQTCWWGRETLLSTTAASASAPALCCMSGKLPRKWSLLFKHHWY